MNRIFIGWFGALALVGIASVGTQEASAVTPACRLGRDLRTALGFGSVELTAMNVDQATETSIINAATSFCDQNRETIEPLITAYRTAKQQATLNYEMGLDTTNSDQSLLDAIADLEAESSDVISTMQDSLSSNQQSLQTLVASHHLLEPSIGLLDLTSQQETTIRAAQRTRDAILRHHKSRKDGRIIAAAQAAFESVLASTLTEAQVTQRNGLSVTIRQHLDDVESVQSGLCD